MAIAVPWGEGCHFCFFRQQDHVQSVPETAHAETSLISPYIQRLTGLWVGLTGTDHPFRSFSQQQELQKKLEESQDQLDQASGKKQIVA